MAYRANSTKAEQVYEEKVDLLTYHGLLRVCECVRASARVHVCVRVCRVYVTWR